MQQMLHTGKRVVSAAVAAATIAVSVGLAGLIAPSQANAASAGDLIKGSLSTVYYYGYDGMRYTFPDELTYKSWFPTSTGAADFSDVTTIGDSTLADIELAGNAVLRPGSYFVKITSDPKVYAVSTNGSIHWIESEEVALDLAGSNWASSVRDVPDAFFVDYTVGASLMDATAFDGMLYMDGGNYFIAWDGEKRMISSSAVSANHLYSGFFLDGSGIDDSDLSAGDDITTAVTALMDPAQTEEMTDGVSGDVSVSLASSTPAAATVPDGASGVTVATYKVTATEDAEIDVMSVTLSGLASTTYVSNVYLYEGAERLTNGKSFNSSTREVTFGSLNWAIEGGETSYLSVVVDLADFDTDDDGTNDLSSSSLAVSIADAEDVEVSGGDASGNFPIAGNTMSVVDGTVGTVTIEPTGSLADPTVGAADATIAKFKLTAGSAEDIDVEHITLKIADADDHSDFKLYQSSSLLATGENIGDDLVLFDLTTPYEILEGADRTFTVTADIGGEDGDTIQVYLDNDADLYAVGQTYGFGVTVTSTAYDTTADSSSTTIEGGDVTVQFNGPTQSDISEESEDVELYNFTISAERDVTITQLDFLQSGSVDFATTDLSDIHLVDATTGALVAGPESFTSNTVSFTDEFEVEAGEEVTLKLTADLEAGADAAETIIFAWDKSAMTVEDSNGDPVTDIVPSADLTGNTHRVVASGLTVTLASTPTGTTTVVRGSTNQEVVAYNLAAASGGDVEVTDLTVAVWVDEDGGGTYADGEEDGGDGDAITTKASERITSCSLYDASDALIAGPESVSSASTGDILFENFSAWIDAGTTERWEVRCDFANVDPVTADKFAWQIDAAADVTALDEDGDAATVTATAVNTSQTANVEVTNAGSLTLSAVDTPADFVLTNSTSNVVSKFRFDASNESFTIDRLTLTEQRGASDTGTSDAYANNISLVSISYPKADGTTGTASGALSGNEITFNGLSMYVAKSGRATLTVSVDIAESDNNGGYATSNERVLMGLSLDEANEDQFRATSSSTTLDDTDLDTADGLNDGVISANASINSFVVRETVPTFSISSSSPAGSASPNGEALRFNVSAANGEDVILDQITFKIVSNDAGGQNWDDCDTNAAASLDDSEFSFYNLANPGTALDTADTNWIKFTAAGALCDDSTATNVPVGFVTLRLPVAETITAGTTKTYSLSIDATGAGSDDSLRVDIATEGSATWATTTADNSPDALAITATQFAPGAATDFYIGDVLCYTGADSTTCESTDERMLVVTCTDATSNLQCDSGSLTVVRGYLGSARTATIASGADAYEIVRQRGTMLWQDDGSSTATAAAEERWGGYLVETITGGTLAF